MPILRAFARVELVLAILMMAVVCYEPAAVRSLVRSLTQPATEPRLVNAAAMHDSAAVDEALDGGVNVNQRDLQNITALMTSASIGDESVVRRLIRAGADVNATDVFGETALMYAARSNYADVVRELLEHGADATLVAGQSHVTALDMATYSGADTAAAELRRHQDGGED